MQTPVLRPQVQGPPEGAKVLRSLEFKGSVMVAGERWGLEEMTKGLAGVQCFLFMIETLDIILKAWGSHNIIL